MYSYIKLSRQLICFLNKKEWRKKEEIHGTTSQLLNTILRIKIKSLHFIYHAIIWWMTVCLSLIMSDWNVLYCDTGSVQKVQFSLSFFFWKTSIFPPLCSNDGFSLFWIFTLFGSFGGEVLTYVFLLSLWYVWSPTSIHSFSYDPINCISTQKGKRPSWINWPSLWKAGAV